MSSPVACWLRSLMTGGLLLIAPIGLCQTRAEINSGGTWNTNWSQLSELPQRDRFLDRTEGPIDFGGWVSAGWTANGDGNRTGMGNAPLPLNDVADGPVVNQLWFYFEKTPATDDQPWDWGVRIDYVFGTDGPDFQARGDRGWDFGWNNSRDYGVAIPQFTLLATECLPLTPVCSLHGM